MNSRIFRREAIDRYFGGIDKAEFPKLISPSILPFIWVLISLLIVLGGLSWVVKVPMYSKVVTVFIDPHRQINKATHQPTMILLAPPENRAHLRVGQMVYFRLKEGGELLSRPIYSIEPELQQPGTLQKTYGITPSTPITTVGPVAIAFIDAGAIPTELPLSAYVGSVYEAQIEVGSQRIVSLLH